MHDIKYSVSAILVTYGKRWKFLKEVLERLLVIRPRLEKIIIVNNGSEDDIAAHIEGLQEDTLKLVNLGENTGSANGFKVGIATALSESDATFFWLLDDDNKPGTAALTKLIAAHQVLGGDSGNTLVSMRMDRQEFVNAALYGVKVVVRENSFMGFHPKDIPAKVLSRCRKRQGNTLAADLPFPLVSVGFSPYGGFFFHRRWIETIGLPNEQFFLYGDDHDFTRRVVTHGGRIYLCATSEVEDLEISWNKTRVRSHRLISPESSAVYVYYSTRNRVYSEVSNYVTSNCVYYFNMLIMMTLLLVLGICTDKKPLATIKRWQLLWAAVWAGKRGRLGRGMYGNDCQKSK